jgi:hypothetical protein
MSKKKWKRSEDKLVDVAPGGKIHRGSGSRWWNKMDGSNDEIVVENKWTEKNQYILKKDFLLKCRQQAWRSDKKFRLRVDFDGEIFVVIPLEDL